MKQLDLTNGPIRKNIYRYALPLGATSILQQLFNTADVAIVGRFAGTEAMAAVGTNSSLIMLIVNFFVGLSLGSNVLISQAIGRKDEAGIKKAVHTSVVLSLTGGLFLMVLCLLLSARIISALCVPDDVFADALLYFRVYLTGLPVIFLYNFEAAIFRSDGDTRTPLKALMSAGVLNVLLNLVFVIVLKLSVIGVALATVLSNLVSSLYLFKTLLRSERSIRVLPSALKIDLKILASIIRIGLPSGVQSAMFSFANIVIQTAINSLGTAAIAASSVSINLEMIAYYVMNAFGQTCTTFVGQNYGAGKPERCRLVFRDTFFNAWGFTMLTCIVICFFSRDLCSLFTTDQEVIELTRLRLFIIFTGYTGNCWLEICSGYLRGFGLSFVPALCASLGICGIRILWVMTVFRAAPSFTRLMTAYPVSLLTTGTAALFSVLLIRPTKRFMKTA